MKELFRKKSKNDISGFSLLELLVTVAVIGLLTAIVVFNQGDFSDNITLNSAVTDLELQIREAQVYGISVREFQTGTNEFNASYGVHFDLVSGGGDLTYLFFADRGVKNGQYDGSISCATGGANECIRKFSLTKGNTISDVCAIIDVSGTLRCNSSAAVSKIDIIFNRPDPGPAIKFFNPAGNEVTFPGHQGAKVTISSPKGTTRQVYIYTNGQISIQ